MILSNENKIKMMNERMTLDLLQSMTDTELNELAAVKVMGWTKVKDENGIWWIEPKFKSRVKSYLSGDWNPTGDMKDAMELTKWIDDPYTRHIYVETLRKVQGWNTDFVGNDIMYALIHSTPRERTIASILVKE